MASIREIRQRREAIRSAQQITKAMKLASTAKLQKARRRLDDARPYHRLLCRIVSAIAEASLDKGIYGETRDSGRRAVAVISSNRGLAGGYNHQMVRLVSDAEALSFGATDIYAIGRKARDGLARLGYEIHKDYSEYIENPRYQEAVHMAAELLKDYRDGRSGEVYLAYTSFQNTITHTPVLLKLLPWDPGGFDGGFPIQGAADGDVPLSSFRDLPMNYEAGEGGDTDEAEQAAAMLDALMPQYLAGMIYGAMLEASASEHGARMAAMDHASENAHDLIEELTGDYNQARQSLITRELTEIIAGAAAIT